MKGISVLLQTGLLLLLWCAGELLVRATGLPVPGGVAGLVMLLALLATGLLPLTRVARGADWLLGCMLLFFVPAVLAVLDHPLLVGITGLKILLVLVVGTAAVMATVAAVVQLALRHGRDDEPGAG